MRASSATAPQIAQTNAQVRLNVRRIRLTSRPPTTLASIRSLVLNAKLVASPRPCPFTCRKAISPVSNTRCAPSDKSCQTVGFPSNREHYLPVAAEALLDCENLTSISFRMASTCACRASIFLIVASMPGTE